MNHRDMRIRNDRLGHVMRSVHNFNCSNVLSKAFACYIENNVIHQLKID